MSVKEKALRKVSGKVQGDERKRITDEVSKTKDGVETGDFHYSRISPGGDLFTAWVASGIKVA